MIITYSEVHIALPCMHTEEWINDDIPLFYEVLHQQ